MAFLSIVTNVSEMIQFHVSAGTHDTQHIRIHIHIHVPDQNRQRSSLNMIINIVFNYWEILGKITGDKSKWIGRGGLPVPAIVAVVVILLLLVVVVVVVVVVVAAAAVVVVVVQYKKTRRL